MKQFFDRERIMLTELNSNISFGKTQSDKPYLVIDGVTYFFGKYCDFSKLEFSKFNLADYALLRKTEYSCIIEATKDDKRLPKYFKHSSDAAWGRLYEFIREYSSRHVDSPNNVADEVIRLFRALETERDNLQLQIAKMYRSCEDTVEQEAEVDEPEEQPEENAESIFYVDESGCVMTHALDPLTKALEEFNAPRVTMEQFLAYVKLYKQYREVMPDDGDTFNVFLYFEGAIQKACDMLGIENTYKIMHPSIAEMWFYQEGYNNHWQS